MPYLLYIAARYLKYTNKVTHTFDGVLIKNSDLNLKTLFNFSMLMSYSEPAISDDLNTVKTHKKFVSATFST